MCKLLFYLFLLLQLLLGKLMAADQNYETLVHLYDYDQNAPLDVKEQSVVKRGGINVHDISYASPKGGRVTAYNLPERGLRRYCLLALGSRQSNGISCRSNITRQSRRCFTFG